MNPRLKTDDATIAATTNLTIDLLKEMLKNPRINPADRRVALMLPGLARELAVATFEDLGAFFKYQADAHGGDSDDGNSFPHNH